MAMTEQEAMAVAQQVWDEAHRPEYDQYVAGVKARGGKEIASWENWKKIRQRLIDATAQRQKARMMEAAPAEMPKDNIPRDIVAGIKAGRTPRSMY